MEIFEVRGSMLLTHSVLIKLTSVNKYEKDAINLGIAFKIKSGMFKLLQPCVFWEPISIVIDTFNMNKFLFQNIVMRKSHENNVGIIKNMCILNCN